MMPLRSAVIVPFVSTAFDEHGAPTNSAIETAASIMLDDLEWWGVALQKARQERQLPPTTFRNPAAGKAHYSNQFPPTSDTSSSSH